MSSPKEIEQQHSPQHLEPETWSTDGSIIVDDADSTFAASFASSSESLASSIMRHREENGRSYHAYKEGRYVLPNDECPQRQTKLANKVFRIKSENDRLDLQHMLFTLTFDKRLTNHPSLPGGSPRRVLDAGTGTGVWAIDYGSWHRFKPQPNFVPPNLVFYIDDLEDSWTFSYKFDLIYARMLTGSLRDWPKFIQQSYDNLESGGWLEVTDILLEFKSDDDSIPKGSAAARWGELMLEAADKFGAPLDSCKQYKQQLADSGFINITETLYKWPSNGWPKDPKFKELGVWNYQNLGNGASGLSLALFSRALGWTREEIEVFLVDVRNDMKNRAVHGWWPIYVVCGQKP